MRTAIALSRTHVHRRSTDAAPVLSDQNHKPLHVICTYTNLLFVRAFACLTSVCDAEQLYTDAAPAYSARAIRIKATQDGWNSVHRIDGPEGNRGNASDHSVLSVLIMLMVLSERAQCALIMLIMLIMLVHAHHV